MTSPLSRFLRTLALVAALAAPLHPARALVGGEPDGRYADRVAMVLIRGGDKAGFCTGLVLSPRVLLTAAHCLRALPDMAVHYRDGAGAPVVIPVDAAISHPLYRPDAIKARVESIDLALIRTARPLPSRFVGAAIAEGGPPPIGAPAIVSGYGAAREGDWSSGGELRSVRLAVREPASTVLIWAADPSGRAAGACNGDSGAPIWSADGSAAIAIVAWAQAAHGRGCGGLTQGPLLGPLKSWIEETERKLAEGG
ncbi:MAG: trypsin-like serine protease [Hyphomicrobiales bacterium]|nr:trypsin-like serine protease [Hyphomicrobiales bacterium]